MSLEDVMKELRVEYLDSVEGKIPMFLEMKKLRRAAELRDEFHKLKGTGATYGIPEISTLGELVETLFIHNAAEGLTHLELTIDLLQNIISHRRRAVEFDFLNEPACLKLQKLVKSTGPKVTKF